MKKIAILIPCYNEARTIGTVVKGFRRVLPKADIYVYDNNSIDKTADIARKEGAIVVPSLIQGKGAVVRHMLIDIDADVYVLVDGDSTYFPEDSIRLIKKLNKGHYDIVLGDRLSGSYFRENKRPLNGIGNLLVRFLIRLKFGKYVSDVMTGYRVFNKKVAKNFVPLNDGFEIETEMAIFAIENDYKMGRMTINYKDRPKGSVSKLNAVSDGWRVLSYILKYRKKKH